MVLMVASFCYGELIRGIFGLVSYLALRMRHPLKYYACQDGGDSF